MSEDDELWDDDFHLPADMGDTGKLVDDQAIVEDEKGDPVVEAEDSEVEAKDSDDDMNDFLNDDSSDEELEEEDEADQSGDQEGVDDEEEEEEEGGDVEDAEEVEAVDQNEDSSNALKRLMQSSKAKPKKKRQKPKKSEFIEDEAELSGDDDVSGDELEQSDEDDQFDPEIVDQEAKDLSSDEEEEVRRLYHKQLEAEDKRAVLILQEQLEENEIGINQRKRKFKWQTRDLMENHLKRHYDPDDEDSADDDDMIEYNEVRLKRPTAESLLLGNTKLRCTTIPHAEYDDEDMFSDDEEDDDSPMILTRGKGSNRAPGTGLASNEDSSSMFMHALPSTSAGGGANGDLNKYVYRDKQLVQALSTKEVIVNTREEKDRIIQRELKKVVQSKSIFDQLY